MGFRRADSPLLTTEVTLRIKSSVAETRTGGVLVSSRWARAATDRQDPIKLPNPRPPVLRPMTPSLEAEHGRDTAIEGRNSRKNQEKTGHSEKDRTERKVNVRNVLRPCVGPARHAGGHRFESCS